MISTNFASGKAVRKFFAVSLFSSFLLDKQVQWHLRKDMNSSKVYFTFSSRSENLPPGNEMMTFLEEKKIDSSIDSSSDSSSDEEN